MSNTNILEPIANSLSEVSKLGLNALYKLMNIKTYFNIENFFKTCELKNKKDQYPTLIKIYSSDKGYIFLMSCPIGLGLSDFMKVHEALEMQLKKPINIKNRDGYIEIEVIEVELPTMVNYRVPLRNKSEGIKIPIGQSLNGIEYISLKDSPHSLICGITGSGKSVMSKSILCSLIELYGNDIELVLIDLKRTELSQFKNLSMTKTFIHDGDSAKEVIHDILVECDRRYSIMEDKGYTSLDDYNKSVPKSKRIKSTIVFIEEFILLDDKKTLKALTKISAISRACNIFIILTCQRFSQNEIPITLRSQIGNRIVHKVADESNSKLILDTEGAETLDVIGRAIFKNNKGMETIQGYYISDSQVRDLTKKYIVTNQAIQEPYSKYKKVNDTLVQNQKETVLKADYETKETTDILEDLSFLDGI